MGQALGVCSGGQGSKTCSKMILGEKETCAFVIISKISNYFNQTLSGYHTFYVKDRLVPGVGPHSYNPRNRRLRQETGESH